LAEGDAMLVTGRTAAAVYQKLGVAGRSDELLSNLVFWFRDLGGDFILQDSVFEGTSFDDEGDLFVAVKSSPSP